jgi:hypothetical protein
MSSQIFVRVSLYWLLQRFQQKEQYDTNIEQIDRGYERIDERLRAIGANNCSR